MTKRSVARVAAVMVGVVLVLMVAVSVVVKRADLESLIIEQARLAAGAEVTLESVSVNWWGGVGLVLHEASIQGSGEAWAKRQGMSTDLGAYDGTFTKIVLKTGLVDLIQGAYLPCAVRFEGEYLTAVVSGETMSLTNFEIDLTNLVFRSETPTLDDLVSGDLNLIGTQYSGQGTVWADVRLNGSWQDNQLRLPELAAQLGSGRIAADVVLDWQSEGPGKISGTVRLQDMPSDLLLSPYWPNLGQRLDCALQGEVVGSMSLGNPAERRESLNLTFSLSAGAGVLDAITWLHEATPYLGDRQDLKVIAFDQLKHEVQIAGGRYIVNSLVITGPETEWDIVGWLEFEGTVMLAARVRLPAGFTPELGSMAFLAEMMRDADGRVNLAANVTGPTAAPTITPDIKQMLQGR